MADRTATKLAAAPAGIMSAAQSGEGILDLIPSGVLMAEKEGRILYANPRAVEILDRPLKGILELGIADLIPAAVLCPPASTPPGPNTARPSCLIQTPGGHSMMIGFRHTHIPARDAGSLTCLILFQDITQVEQLHRLLHRAAMAERLPTLVHELRNPLAAATTALELVVEDMPADERRSDLTAVLGELRRLKVTMDGGGLSGDSWIDGAESDISQALEDTFRVLEPRMRGKGIGCSKAIDAMPPLPLDPNVVRAIAFNLLNNSFQACSAGDLVEIGAKIVGDGVLECWVNDSGPGMAETVAARCRELFFTTKPNGTGIGLALCAAAAERLNGTLAIDSAPGCGTRVSMRIPFAKRAK